MTKPNTIIAAALDHRGCPYVYGAWGNTCTVKLRKKYARLRPSQASKIYGRCQQLKDGSKLKTCAGCKYEGKLAYDCRGFTHWALKQAGIDISGQSVATQWSGKGNWAEKGDIAAMPDLVCCVFIREASGKWSHTGLHIGGGRIIHCSGEVKEDVVGGDRRWSHYAIPAGLYTPEEIRKAHEERGTFMRIMRKGSQGEDVRALQEMLNGLGFACGRADGIYGANTEAAVKAFQAVNGIKADGIAGPQTLELLAAQAARPDVDPDVGPDEPETDPDEGGSQDVEPAPDPYHVTVPRHELDQVRRALVDIADLVEKWMEGQSGS